MGIADHCPKRLIKLRAVIRTRVSIMPAIPQMTKPELRMTKEISTTAFQVVEQALRLPTSRMGPTATFR